jgi:glutamine cyclotransferase
MNNNNRRRSGLLGMLLITPFVVIMCKGTGRSEHDSAVPKCIPVIVGSIPHPDAPFTQGLCYDNGVLYQSSGLYGESAVRSLDTNGVVRARQPMAEQNFGEGCALLDGRLFQITWREQRGYVYSLPMLAPVDSFRYQGEGWGLCTVADRFFMSDGSDRLSIRDARFAMTGSVAVTCGGKPLVNLNELEFARGYLYANVWYSDFIFEIDPQSGVVRRIIDCSEIVRRENPPAADFVLNGIAWRPHDNRFYITGKKWKNIYIVDIPAWR